MRRSTVLSFTLYLVFPGLETMGEGRAGVGVRSDAGVIQPFRSFANAPAEIR